MDTFKQNTRFTVIVPTRERCDTLSHALRTILSQGYDNFEVLVSDNASNDGTRELVMRLREHDSRILYVNTGHRVSMSENWEFALKNIKDGWVTVLGDDDGLLPGALTRVDQIIKNTGLKAIRSNGCSYSWPSLLGAPYGSMSISKKTGVEVRNSGHMLQKVLDGKCAYNEPPVLYNGGFIAANLLNEARDSTGKIFQSMTPDIYTGVVFSLLTNEYVYCYEPLAINGASSHSAGTAGFEVVKRRRTYDPIEKFWSETNIPFHKDLPLAPNGKPLRSIAISFYEAFLQSQAFHSRKSLKISKTKQLKVILEQSGPDHDEIEDWVKKYSKNNNISPVRLNIFYNLSIRRYFKKIQTTVINGLSRFKIEGAPSIPLYDVYQASIVAGLVKDLKPNIFQMIKFRLELF